LVSYGSKTVQESEAGRDVLEEFRDVVLDGGAVLRGCEQVPIIFREMDTLYGARVMAQGTDGCCGLKVPKNDGVVAGASSDDARSVGPHADGHDPREMSLQRTQSRGVVGVPDDCSLVVGRCEEIFIVGCETAGVDLTLVPSERIQSLSRLHAPLDGRLIVRTCVEMETGRGDDEATNRIFMSLKRQKTTPVVNIPQYSSPIHTSADDPIPTRSHRDSVYLTSMSNEGSLSVPVR